MKSTLLFVLFFSISCLGFAQNITISGTVYDEHKNIVADANVFIKNAAEGIITDKNGQFTLDVQPKTILQVSYLGFKTQEIVVKKQKQIQIILEEDVHELETVTLIAYNPVVCKVTKICKHMPICRMVDSEEKIEYILRCGVKGVNIPFEKAPQEKAIPTLFPNPSANGLFQLQLDKIYDNLTIEVFNMNGQLIQTTTHTKLSKIPQIDLSKQPKGIYLIRTIVDGTLLETKKAIRS